ncbi:MAG: hypothetical protein ACR2RF_26065 [Geminicoccaceae bacterium]
MRISHLTYAGLVAIATTATFLAPVTAFSQQRQRVPCGDRTAIIDHLKDGYSESVTAMGLDSQGRVLEVLTAQSGTWTMLISTPDGRTCLIASGIAWEELQIKAGEGPAL